MISHLANDYLNWNFAVGIILENLLCAILIPIAKILRRMGLSGWWSFLFLTGIGAIIGMWVLASCHWPALDRTKNSN